MNVIDAVDYSSIYRRDSYGMLQDEVAKYSLNLTKINIANAHKPKIYNIKSPEGAGIFALNKNNNGRGLTGSGQGKPQVMLEAIKVNYTVLADRFNVVAKSDNVLIGKKNFYGIGKLKLVLQPFDNIIQFIVAQDVNSDQQTVDAGNGTTLQYVNSPVYMDMTNMGEIKLIIKNDKLSVECKLYMASNQVDLSRGVVVFKVPSSRMNDVKKIYDSGINVFYITSSQDSGTVVVYSGIYIVYDSKDNVINLNNTVAQMQANMGNNQEPSIITDPNAPKGTAIVTRKLVGNTTTTMSATASVVNGSSTKDNTSTTTSTTSTSTEASTKIGGVTYTVTSGSGIKIDGMNWSSGNIKGALSLTSNPTNLTIKSDSLYSNGKYLDKLSELKKKLENKYVLSSDEKTIHTQVTKDFKNNNPQ
jgi:hypothetical protein